jgi:pantetheine-phosphate adenylyltransferase
MAHTNREIAGVETLFLPAAGSLSHIHGRFVREIAAAGGDLARLVTPEVEAALRRRFGG